MKTRHLLTGFLSAAALLLVSCRAVSYYTQAAQGQWRILHGAVPVEKVLADPSVPDKIKEKLQLVAELRRFAAKELHLPAESQYDHYCDLQRPYVVWVVFAAPEFSVEAKTWWYPLVGSLKYRGYFREADAKAEADRLRARGCDVFMAGTEAYSTLGWLRDPVLNTFLNRSDADLAELVFHELTHQRLYLSGDTDFNEAFATAVGEAGTRRWLQSKGRSRELEVYESGKRFQRAVISALLACRDRLNTLYGEPPEGGESALRGRKAAELQTLRKTVRQLRLDHGVTAPAKGAPTTRLNNASLNSAAAYYTLLPGFERILGEVQGDIGGFFARVEAMKPLSREQRKALLAAP